MAEAPGRKSDIQDAQWIQTLHSYGLLESSFRPSGELVALRTLLRHRNQLVEHRSPHIQHMQKALLQMNVQLSQALSDITGETGLRIIRAIVAGERAANTGGDARSKLQEERLKRLVKRWRNVAGRTSLHRPAIAGDVRLLRSKWKNAMRRLIGCTH
ncbi:MAG: transposase [Anaerolineales bacterium]|nr:transposase [Anaerolineales bacterium]